MKIIIIDGVAIFELANQTLRYNNHRKKCFTSENMLKLLLEAFSLHEKANASVCYASNMRINYLIFLRFVLFYT